MGAVKPFGFFLVLRRNGEALSSFQTRASAATPLPPFTRADAVRTAETVDHPDHPWLDAAATATLHCRRIYLPWLDDNPITPPPAPRSAP